MIEAKVDKDLNVLKVSYLGHVGPDETKHGAEELARLVTDLPPGFRLLADLSGLEAMDIECLPHLNRMMDVCNQRSVDTVVRVIPDPHKDIGLKIMSLFHYQRSVRIVTCATLEEALQVLAK